MRARTVAFLAAAFLLSAANGRAEPAVRTSDQGAKTPLRRYLRLTRNGDEPKALEAAIARFTPADGSKGVVVDLVGAVHVAEGNYYRQLNKEFDQYDVVLYELVAPEGARPPREPGAARGSPVSAVQTGMTRILNLQFQLDAVNYHRPNMVHADLSPEEFSRSMRDRGENLGTLFARAMGYAMAKQANDPNANGDLSLLMALFDKNQAGALKRVMAEQMMDLGGVIQVIEGKDGSTLIADRNRRVMEALREQIDAGKTKIAIFYGAGHMPDMEARLKKDFGLARAGTRWLVAWDLTMPGSPKK
ncbi:MAG: hypothetical protein JW809_03010 [Pirellulales bacterium]|nr:hypothetical protein [Pirellulales bacterium]